MTYTKRVLVFVVLFVIIGFLILSTPKTGFSGVVPQCCQDGLSSCFDIGPLDICLLDNVREGEICNKQTGQCEPPLPPPPPTCCQDTPSSCFNLGPSNPLCLVANARDGETCNEQTGQCEPLLIATFPCTDPDCQSQQACEDLRRCSGDDSTLCFWNGSECLNPLPPPPSPTPTPTSMPTPSIAPSPSPSPTPGAFQPGDGNGDGEINILDVTAILNDILVISPAPGNADCNEDGDVNILDVTCVLNIILGF